MAYSDKVIDHYENPRNVGKLDEADENVGTGMVGAPACGDVMRLQIQVNEDGIIEDAKFKTYGCGSAIASSSLLTEWVKGKSADSFAPMGPYMVTQDEVKDPDNLKLWLKVNGELKQNSSTNDMIFDVATLVSYISEFMTLLPGDVISCGTPEGVGMGQEPPQYLKSGDVIEMGIESLGEARQEVVSLD